VELRLRKFRWKLPLGSARSQPGASMTKGKVVRWYVLHDIGRPNKLKKEAVLPNRNVALREEEEIKTSIEALRRSLEPHRLCKPVLSRFPRSHPGLHGSHKRASETGTARAFVAPSTEDHIAASRAFVTEAPRPP